jgi:CHASE2 domain-containing sensor protein
MSILVVLNFGAGSLRHGFPRVIAQLWEKDSSTPMQFIGSLPAIAVLDDTYQKWKQLYTALYSHLDWRKTQLASEFEIDETDVTHISEAEFKTLSQVLQDQMNRWLNADSFRSIDRQLHTRLTPQDEIRVIIVAEDPTLLRLPWCVWDFLTDYPKAEIALSPPEYARSLKSPIQKSTDQVRILSVLGNASGINVSRDQQALEQLPNADIHFLTEPKSQDLNRQLWQPGWDVLFFAGHSSSQEKGIIHLNRDESLTVDQLKYGLKTAIEHGLKLAIFNSCDGLGLARDLADLYLPQVIVMRESVPDRVAQEFLKNFLSAFSQGQSLYLAVRQAREQLQALETEFPCATWLPVICQNPAELPPLWKDWCTTPSKSSLFPTRKELKKVLFGSLAIAACVVGVRSFGGLQSLELSAFDRFMQLRPKEDIDRRLLVVNVTQADIDAASNQPRRPEESLSDKTLTQLLEKLEQHNPTAIGLDIYRDAPDTDPSLRDRLKTSDRTIGICKRPDSDQDLSGIGSLPEVPQARVGFSDLTQDPQRVIRRQLLVLSPQATTTACQTPYSFSIQLAFRYLYSKQKISPTFTPDKSLKFNNTVLRRITSRTGGYQTVDARGNQILLNYRATPRAPLDIARQVTVAQVLKGEVNPDLIRDKVVLIGVAVQKRGDYWATPYGSEPNQQIPGVLIHAHMISQVISAVLDGRPLLWVGSAGFDVFWIASWAVVGGMIAWRFRGSVVFLGLSLFLATGTLIVGCVVILMQGGWMPFVPSVLCLVVTTGAIASTFRVNTNNEPKAIPSKF